MIPTLAGMIVARAIPTATLAGLAMGNYVLHGSVVRWAAGTPQAGQIVAHLLPTVNSAVSSLSGAGIITATAAAVPAQIASGVLPLLSGVGIITGLSSTIAANAATSAATTAASAATTAASIATVAAGASVVGGIGAIVGAGFGIANFFQNKQIFKAVQATMQLAELNIAVTQSSFADLDQRLIRLEQMLREVQQTVKGIQSLLESSQRAELLAALEHLEKFPRISDDRVRIELLTHSATNLGKLRRIYYAQMQQAENIPSGMSTEEYYLIAALAQVRCYAELRELAMARSILSDVINEWRAWARPFMRTQLLGTHPQRFLYGDLAASAPLTLISAWLDFANDRNEGLTGLEELRLKVKPWYYHRSTDGEPVTLRRSSTTTDRDTLLANDRNQVIPSLNKLVARHAVLSTYEAQYELMEQVRMTPGELEASIAAMPLDESDADAEPMLVLLAA